MKCEECGEVHGVNVLDDSDLSDVDCDSIKLARFYVGHNIMDSLWHGYGLPEHERR